MPDSITLASAELQADGKTVIYVFSVDITPAPAHGAKPIENTNKIPLIGKYTGPGKDKFADHDGGSDIGGFDSSKNEVSVEVTYDGLFYEDQDTEVIGSGTIFIPNDSAGATTGWIKHETSPGVFVLSESLNGITITTSQSTISPAPLLSATVGESTNPPSLGDDYWEVKFTFDNSSGETPKLRETLRPQFKSIDAKRRLFVKSVDPHDFTDNTITVSGRLSRAITSSETVEVSIPSGYITTDSQASVRVYEQSITNNSGVLQLGPFPEIALRTFPDDLESSTELYGPTCVGVAIDPQESDPGGDAIWSRCVVKHTITIKELGTTNTIHLPSRYRNTNDPRDGYEDAVDGNNSADSFVRDWEADAKGFAHCIVAIPGDYT